ncbi:MAG: hypothetical protein COW67_13415 [Flavobacteriales bacterium CG18_big_fil_WC_8_21_14_2_50_32_9]|nr:MAG: hypothetical protein COW67_13415 [Flavobacteriales bacterium CG18_big_fil_WC_8_21_14_2_50_32_9]PJC61993.1 MAG: hypothetical protein CO022_06895 [Flavobacteriales bacterium CG_4_9_14_0_2_um_filter_32_27]
MKNIAFILLLFSFISFFSCDNEEKSTDENKIIVLKGYEELDLTQWGFPMSVMVPDAENNGEAQVTLTNRGALEIIVGQSFGIEIIYGEGDIELLKMDLEEDLVFSSEIVKEDSTLLIYKQDIPESGIKTQHHFFYKTLIGNDIYEVRDLQGEQYGEKMIEDMIKAAQTLRFTPITSSEPKV